MIEKFVFTKEVLIAAAATLAAVLCNIASNQRRNWLFYVFFFFLMYILFMGSSLCCAKELVTKAEFSDIRYENCETDDFFNDFSKSLVVEKDDGILFKSFDASVFDSQVFSDFVGRNAPSRNELIQKMLFHKNGHDVALSKSEDVLRNCKLWNDNVEELYKAARTAVATYAGCRNFLLPAIVVIIEYAFEKSWHLLMSWKEYQSAIYEAQYHAEMFDFYMRVLKLRYGS